jgi:hypothetical protein
MLSPRLRAAVAFGLSGAGMTVGVVLGNSLPDRLDDRSAYETAEECVEGTRQSRHCWTLAPAVVERRVAHTYKGDRFKVFVLEEAAPAGHRREIEIPRDTPVFYALSKGESVHLRMFRGRVVRIQSAVGTLITEESPHVAAAQVMVEAWTLITISGLVFVFGIAFIRESISIGDSSFRVLRRRAGTPWVLEPSSPEARASRLLFPVALGGIATLAAVDGYDITDLTDILLVGFAATAVPLALVCVFVIKAQSRSARRQTRMPRPRTPDRPRGRRCQRPR